MEIITSRQNPLCTHLRKLAASASYRRQRGEFLCDSPKLLKEALLWGAEVRTVVATAGVDLPELPLGVRQVEVPAEVMKSLSPMETPQGTLFTCAIHTEPLPEMLTGSRYGAGHLAGPRQRGYHPPHGGRLPCRWNVSGERLRGSL